MYKVTTMVTSVVNSSVVTSSVVTSVMTSFVASAMVSMSSMVTTLVPTHCTMVSTLSTVVVIPAGRARGGVIIVVVATALASFASSTGCPALTSAAITSRLAGLSIARR